MADAKKKTAKKSVMRDGRVAWSKATSNDVVKSLGDDIVEMGMEVSENWHRMARVSAYRSIAHTDYILSALEEAVKSSDDATKANYKMLAKFRTNGFKVSEQKTNAKGVTTTKTIDVKSLDALADIDLKYGDKYRTLIGNPCKIMRNRMEQWVYSNEELEARLGGRKFLSRLFKSAKEASYAILDKATQDELMAARFSEMNGEEYKKVA